jgi:hypothetical protein
MELRQANLNRIKAKYIHDRFIKPQLLLTQNILTWGRGKPSIPGAIR